MFNYVFGPWRRPHKYLAVTSVTVHERSCQRITPKVPSDYEVTKLTDTEMDATRAGRPCLSSGDPAKAMTVFYACKTCKPYLPDVKRAAVEHLAAKQEWLTAERAKMVKERANQIARAEAHDYNRNHRVRAEAWARTELIRRHCEELDQILAAQDAEVRASLWAEALGYGWIREEN